MSDIVQTQDKRRTFVDTLNKLGETDDRILVIIPDVGFNYLEGRKNFRIMNLGATEQTCIMMAVGLAKMGWKVYVYSMINFVLFRPAEMVRNGIVNHNVNVKLVGVKGSDKYKFLGFSHNLMHEKEDFNFCDNIGLKWHDPKDNKETEEVIKETYKEEKACYIRL